MVSNPNSSFEIYSELDSGTEVFKESLFLCDGGLPVPFLAYKESNLGKFLFAYICEATLEWTM